MIRARLIGAGGYLPARIVTNAELAERLDTSNDWIVQRTGIRQRHIAAEGELTSDLALAAARAALAQAGVAASEVDLIIVATTSPDRSFPATACEVQAKLGVTGGFAFDVQAVCTGFLYALTQADNAIRLGQAKTALVIGAETFSRLLDWQDRSTCVLFGDGAGAVVLRAEREPGASRETTRGVLATHLRADGRHRASLQTDGGPSLSQTVGFVRMEGREVFRHGVLNLAGAAQTVLAACDLPVSAVDWLVPHQANLRMLEATAHKLAIDPARVVVTVDCHANTSAASVPLALAQGMGDGRIKDHHLVLFTAMGGGFTWGAALVRL